MKIYDIAKLFAKKIPRLPRKRRAP